MRLQRVLAALAAIVVAGVGVVIARPAVAGIDSSDCYTAYSGRAHCIHWGQKYNGSASSVYGNISNFPVSGSTSYVYLSGGSGQGQYIGNNNGSNRNWLIFCEYRIYYSPNYSGPSILMAQYGNPGWSRNGSGLGTLLNNIRSQTEYCYPD